MVRTMSRHKKQTMDLYLKDQEMKKYLKRLTDLHIVPIRPTETSLSYDEWKNHYGTSYEWEDFYGLFSDPRNTNTFITFNLKYLNDVVPNYLRFNKQWDMSSLRYPIARYIHAQIKGLFPEKIIHTLYMSWTRKKRKRKRKND